MRTENLKVTGQLTIEHWTEDGIRTTSTHNLVVSVGKEFIVSRMIGTSAPVMSHMGLGTGATAPVVLNTALQTPAGPRVAFVSASSVANTVTYVASFLPGVATGAITEAGIFNNLTNGTMLARTTFAAQNKAASDTIVVTWAITIN